MATERLDMPTYRVPRSEGLDGSTKRLALTAAGLGAALVLVLGLWSTSGQRSGDVQVIRAEPGPYRVKPTDPGGMKLNGAEEDISSGTGKADNLTPPPETPEPSALRKNQSDSAASSAPAAPSAATAASLSSTAIAPNKPAVSATAPGPASATKPAVSTPAPAAATPATRPAVAAPAPASPRAAAEPAGKTEVQLAAVGSEADAQKEWARLAHKAPELFSSRKALVTRLDRDGKAFWRVRTGGFADIAEATRFCEQARAKGVACSIAAF